MPNPPSRTDAAALASADLSAAERGLARLLGQLLAEMWDREVETTESPSNGPSPDPLLSPFSPRNDDAP
jgi:hypothetical protein